MSEVLDCLLDLSRRLPPQNIDKNLVAFTELREELADEIFSSIDQPFSIRTDSKTAKQYLANDFNRDGDSYRSPWSSEYDPPLADGTQPSPRLRKIEETANEAFDVYREMYYEGGISSVYLWDLETEGSFAGVVLLQKVHSPSQQTKESTADASSAWDSIHVFEAFEKGRTAHYKLTSTVMLRMSKTSEQVGKMELAGSLTRQNEQEMALDPVLKDGLAHVPNLGRYIEEQETKMRSSLQEVYFQKTRNIANDVRSIEGADADKARNDIQAELVGKLRKT